MGQLRPASADAGDAELRRRVNRRSRAPVHAATKRECSESCPRAASDPPHGSKRRVELPTVILRAFFSRLSPHAVFPDPAVQFGPGGNGGRGDPSPVFTIKGSFPASFPNS